MSRRGSCDFSRHAEILPYVLQNLTSAGRTKLSLQEISLADIQLPQQAVKTVRDTVPLCVWTASFPPAFSISRGKAADYMPPENAELNYAPLHEGRQASGGGRRDVTIRGLGKIRLETIGAARKRGCIAIEITRFL